MLGPLLLKKTLDDKKDPINSAKFCFQPGCTYTSCEESEDEVYTYAFDGLYLINPAAHSDVDYPFLNLSSRVSTHTMERNINQCSSVAEKDQMCFLPPLIGAMHYGSSCLHCLKIFLVLQFI